MKRDFIVEENDPARTIPGEVVELTADTSVWYIWRCFCGVKIKTTNKHEVCPYCGLNFQQAREATNLLFNKSGGIIEST